MASTTARPGSLTFLAIVNFVLAGFGVMGLMGQVALLLMANHIDDPGMQQAVHSVPPWWQWTAVLGSMVEVAALIVSGIGLLRLSVVWGRWTATVAAVLSLAMALAQHLATGAQANDQVLPFHLLGLALSALYPLVLLAWVHGVVADVWHPPRIPTHDGSARPVSPLLLTLVQSLRQNLRGAAGPGFILGLVFTGLLVCGGVLITGRLSHDLGKQTGLAATEQQQSHWVERGTAGLLGLVLREGEPAPGVQPFSARWATFLVREHPAPLSFTWLLLAIVLPPCVLFAACGQIARDAGNRGFRFLLTRIDRRSIFLGRSLAAAVLASGVIVVVVAACAVVLGLAQTQPAWGAIAGWSAWAAAALVIASLPFIALGMLASTLINHGFAALTVAQAALIGWPILALVAGKTWEPLGYSLHLLPVAVQFGLFLPEPWMAGIAALLCLVYTAVYLWLGLRHFETRDL